MKILPKSLHTVRVLTVMAKQNLAYAKDARRSPITIDEAVKEAAHQLGYRDDGNTYDQYGLIAKAVAQLESWQPEDHEIVPTGSTFDTAPKSPHTVMASYIRRGDDYGLKAKAVAQLEKP